MYKALTIAGSDTSGGAGMEADLKTFQELGVYGLVALTCIVAQNPRNNWSHDLYPLGLELIEKQLTTVVEGIGVEALKTGMLGSAALVQLIADTIDHYKLRHVVIDPVMVCKGVDAIMVPEAAVAIKELLLTRAEVLTPNLLEAAYLAGMEKVDSKETMQEAAARIHAAGTRYIIIKAGDRLSGAEAVDLFYDGREFAFITAPKLTNIYNHGAGCTFSAGITAGLAKGLTVREAYDNTKEYLTAALKASFKLNQYAGAVKHCAWRSEK